MKKSFTIQLIGLLFACVGVLNAQVTLTVPHITAGSMQTEIITALSTEGKTAGQIETLVVTGSAYVNYADCQAIASTFTTTMLKTLDLSAAAFQSNATPVAVGSNGAFNIAGGNGLQVIEVKLPPTLISIGTRFFGKFKNLTTVNLPATLESIGIYAFVACDKLVSLSLPSGLKTINEYAFYQCSLLSIASLPASLTLLGQQAFYQTSVSISSFPTGITSVLSNCFNANAASVPARAKITSLTFHGNITNIATMAFATQSALTSITANRTTPPTTAADAFNGITLSNINLYVPVGSISNYSALPWSSMIIHEIVPPILTVTHTTAGDMANEINAALTTSGKSAADIDKLVITGSAYVNYADCQAIASTFTTSTLKTLDLSSAAFENDATPVAVGNSGAFNIGTANGLQVTEVKLPSTLKVIGSRFFSKFKNLTTVNLPETLEELGLYAFVACDKLVTVSLPSGLKTISGYAFYQCSLFSISALPSSLTSLGDYAFYQTSVSISSFPTGLTSIPSNCFNPNANASRAKITSLIFHSNIASIATQAFATQTSLTSITVNRSTPPTTVADAFNGITLSNIDLYIPVGSSSNYSALPWSGMNIHDNITTTTTIVGTQSATGYSFDASSIINVNSGAELTIDANTIAHSVIVNPGGKLTISSGQTFAAANGITLQSTADGTATLVDKTDGNGQTLTGSVQQYLATTRNWYVSSPVSNAAAPSGYTYYRRNEPAATPEISWTPISSGTELEAGVGYIALPNSSGAITFTSRAGGKINTGNVTIGLTWQGASSKGYNLIGNPYPSHLTWNKTFTDANAAKIEPTIWYRTNSGSSNTGGWSFKTYNAFTGVGTPSGTTGIIPPMQAFWVLAKVDGQSIQFTNTMRSHQNSNPLKAPVTMTSENRIIRLQVSSGTVADETVILFNANASDGYDNYDSPKMMNNTIDIPDIYTLTENKKLVINGMSEAKYNTEIPLGFNTQKTNEFSISANEISNFEVGTKLILKDKFLAKEIELNNATSYSFTSDATSNENRFSIIVKIPSVKTDAADNNDNRVLICSLNNEIIVNCQNALSNESTVTVHNIVGKQLFSVKLNSSYTKINNTFASGIYLVTVKNAGKITTKRIVIHK